MFLVVLIMIVTTIIGVVIATEVMVDLNEKII